MANRRHQAASIIGPEKGADDLRQAVKHLPPVASYSLNRLRSLHAERSSESLLVRASSIPSDMTLDDYIALHETELLASSPPRSQELMPDVDISQPKQVKDSCPGSPLNLHEVPDSEPELN